MLQEQTVTFSPWFLLDLMIWLQVSFCFDCLVSAEVHFCPPPFLLPIHCTSFCIHPCWSISWMEIRREAHRIGGHCGSSSTTRAVCGVSPLNSLWGIPRSWSFNLGDLLQSLLWAFVSLCSGETRLYQFIRSTWVHDGLDVPKWILMYYKIVVPVFTETWELGSAPGPCRSHTPFGNSSSGSLRESVFTLYLAVF